MKAFGYVRLSKEDAASTSPARQRQKIERLCADRGWDLVETFSDIDVSAFNGKHRPAFEQMMGRLSDVEAIVFWRLDRISRSVSHFSKVLEQTQAAGVQLVSTDQPIDTSSAMGKAFVQISSVFAELESGSISERSRQMMAYKRERSEWVGRVPYGWRLVDKHLVPDPREQGVLKQAARRFVKGETFSAIARDLGFQVGPLSRMLRSERVQDALPPKLAEDLAAATTLRKMQRVPSSRTSLLGGIASCAVCGTGLVLSSTRARHDDGRRWMQYRCPRAGHVGISGPWLENYVTTTVVAMVDTTKLVDELRSRRQRGERRSRKVSDIEARMQLLDEMLVDGKITRARYERMNGELLEKLSRAQRDERADGVDLPAELARDLGNRWETLDIATRRRIIRAVLRDIVVTKSKSHGPITDGEKRVRLVWRLDVEV